MPRKRDKTSAEKPPKTSQKASAKPKHEKAVWTPAQEQRLLAFLTKHKSEAGYGGLFKMTTNNAATTYLNNKKYTGATKTGEIKRVQTKPMIRCARAQIRRG